MSDYGFFAKGNASNLLINTDNPVLGVRYSGSILMTEPPPTVVTYEGVRNGDYFRGTGAACRRVCTVTYPAPITSSRPPLVFAVPGPNADGIGLSFFVHLGSAGNWTGFKVIAATMEIPTPINATPNAGTGWTYRVCDFYLPPSAEKFGMRLRDGSNKLLFDNGWKLGMFRSLLQDWTLTKKIQLDSIQNFTNGDYRYGYEVIGYYWGNANVNLNVQIDQYWSQLSHTWGHPDNTIGVLISSMCHLPIQLDNGADDSYNFNSAGILGFKDGGRSKLYLTMPIGFAQHFGINLQTVNNFSMLTAEFK